MVPSKPEWVSYEDIAIHLLTRFGAQFGLTDVTGRQHIQGEVTNWEIDGRAFRQDSSGFLIIECRRYTTSKIGQERMGGLAFRIDDTGAVGGILVSPLGLQEGAARIAYARNIVDVRLTSESNSSEYLLQVLGRVFAGIQFGARAGFSVSAEVRDSVGNLISRG